MKRPAGETRRFGALESGEAVEAVEIAAGDLRADVIAWGAALRDLRHAARSHPLVLGYERMEDYLAHPRYFGATAGRYANRIANGRFTLDGRAHQLERNFLGLHHLHGGTSSFASRLWTIETASPDSVTLRLVSPDGDGGYPGRVEATCRYEVHPPATLRITYEGVTDAPTILNLAHHSYFNLDGADDVLRHRLRIDASAYLPVDPTMIPTGQIAPVAGTPFDFRQARGIGDESGNEPIPYDHNFCLAHSPRPRPELAAILQGGDGGMSMEVWTTEPGLQFYDGHQLDPPVPVPGLDGRRYGMRAGLCLEPQRWPDSPNRPEFAGAVLRPGETYAQVTEFRFRA